MIKAVALIVLGFASAMAFVKSTVPGDREPQAARETQTDADDDIKPRPHPNWKLLDEQWDGHFERPVAAAQRVKVPCWLYNQNPQKEGDGKIRKLSPVDLFKEDCERLRRTAQ